MKQGDFTLLATEYHNRPGYSHTVLQTLARSMNASRPEFRVADVGAGTGKLTEDLSAIGLQGTAVEPNDAMRAEGMKLLDKGVQFKWQKGSGEETGLPSKSFDWLLMGSSFHWTNREVALREFHRVLKPGGRFTAVWNPRDLERSDLQKAVEDKILEIVPTLKRVSSGGKKYTEDLEEVLTHNEFFEDLIFMEAPHELEMDLDRYLGVWRSVNDIRAQAGEQKFASIMTEIEKLARQVPKIVVPYKTRAWTVTVKS